jgi:hypothetical protein
MTTTTTPSLKLYRDASSSYSFGGFAASQITAFVRTSTTKTNAEPTTVTVSYAFTYSTPGGAPITTTIDASNATPTKLDGQFEDTTLSGRPTPTTSTGFSSPNVIATGTATPQTGFNPSNSNEVNHTGAVKPSNSPSQVPTSSGSIAAAVSITVQGEPNAVGTYTCTPAVSGSSDSTCRLTSTPSNSGSDGALKVSVGVLAALFILALAGFLFLLFRRRNHRDTESHSAPFITPPSGPSHAIGSEKARITALEQQLQAAQTSLLATAVSKPAPIDDRTIASQFDGLAQEIKDWSLTHLRRNPGPHEFSPELREVLRARVPDYERLLTVPKTRGLVVRAAVSALLVDAFEDGYLFPGGSEVRAVEKGMRKNSTPAPIFTQDMR